MVYHPLSPAVVSVAWWGGGGDVLLLRSKLSSAGGISLITVITTPAIGRDGMGKQLLIMSN
jgi:hypothetical protein